MKKNSFLDFVIKNRYIIIFVTIAVLLALLGVVRILIEVAATVFLILIAIYLGKRIQEDDEYISKMFKEKKDIVYKSDEEDND